MDGPVTFSAGGGNENCRCQPDSAGVV